MQVGSGIDHAKTCLSSKKDVPSSKDEWSVTPRRHPGDRFAEAGRAILYLEGIVSSRMFSSLMKPQAILEFH